MKRYWCGVAAMVALPALPSGPPTPAGVYGVGAGLCGLLDCGRVPQPGCTHCDWAAVVVFGDRCDFGREFRIQLIVEF